MGLIVSIKEEVAHALFANVVGIIRYKNLIYASHGVLLE